MQTTATEQGWLDKSDQALLDLILTSGQEPEEKAKAVLAIRERRVAEKHNRLVRVLTLVVTFAALLQAAAEGTAAYIALLPDRQPTCHSAAPK